MLTVDLDAAGIEQRLAIVAGYLAAAGYRAGLTDAQIIEVHEGIGTLAALQAMCGTLRRVGTLQLTLPPGPGRTRADAVLPARTATPLRRPRRWGPGRRTA